MPWFHFERAFSFKLGQSSNTRKYERNFVNMLMVRLSHVCITFADTKVQPSSDWVLGLL